MDIGETLIQQTRGMPYSYIPKYKYEIFYVGNKGALKQFK